MTASRDCPATIIDGIADAILAEANQPRPCPCRACPGGCRMLIAARAPWAVCKSCLGRRHRTAA